MISLPTPRRFFVLPLALLLASAAAACAQTVINTVPYTISTPGKYILGTNLNNASTTAPAITVAAANVSLDLNGFYVSGAGNTASSNAVIYVNNVANVAVRNGLVSNDGYGIRFANGSNARNYTVENMTISRCYQVGVELGGAAPGTLIRNNVFSNLGNAAAAGTTYVYATDTFGGVRIEGNSVANVSASSSGVSIAIYASDGDFIIGNTISNSGYGVDGGKYQNNLTYNCTHAVADGIDAGNNN